jgi:hypothetical protein
VNTLKERLLKDKASISDILDPNRAQIPSADIVRHALEIIEESPLSFGPAGVEEEGS